MVETPTPFGLELDELVKVAALGLRIVVGPASALPRVVSWAHATEMTDPRPHLRGGELVCTVGSALLDVDSCARLVEAVNSVGSAGICFGIGEVHAQVPPALITECQRLSVPLIEMAHGVPFLAINDVLANARILAHETVDHENQNRHRIGQLFALVGQGLADSAALVPDLQLAGLVGKPLTVSAWPTESAALLAAKMPGALVAETPEATFVVTVGSASVYETARELGLFCGHGSPVEMAQISRGIGEARATLGLARRHGKVIGPESLTTLSGLLEQQPAVRLVPFIDQLIRPLIDHDAHRGGQLLATLRTFLEQQGALQATAELQYLHVNTVRHRLARIATLVDRNPLDDNDRVALSIALWAYDRSRRYGT